MKKLFYAGIALLALFEIGHVYLIMPMPGSQELNSIDLAYFLHHYRWWFRVVIGIPLLISAPGTFRSAAKGAPSIALIFLMLIIYFFNFSMTADHMFLQPRSVIFKPKPESVVPDTSIVITIERNGDARAYPIRYLAYHHQVRDTVGGQALMITYCSVCRTGRIFEPVVDGEPQRFRLVGMDHYNAMFEDSRTGSWWRQATGVAVAGPLKGHFLPELDAPQYELKKWFELYPNGKVLQPDKLFVNDYDSGEYEWGTDRSRLTGTDTASWNNKSWVIGVETENGSKAFDWNELVEKRVINDQLDGRPLVIALSTDGQTFAVFERPDSLSFTIRNDSLYTTGNHYDLAGRSSDGFVLKRLDAHQEFWHSWRTFHPMTQRRIQ